MNQPITFSAEIQQHQDINAAFVNFPFDTVELFSKKGQVKVKVLLDDKVEYRSSLANMGGNCHRLGLTQAIRKELGKTFGDIVEVKLWEDKEERIVIVPNDVQKLLNQNEKAKEFYDKMSYTHKKEYIRWIEEAKKEETRERRKIKMIEMLLERKKGI
ncbi:YdeI/OmpD-associated family protein [Epilithonimonas sp.]|uniref:YdeI/OmpD-associated family protein n=1 Tax=Epilithonimonas sp. TaxID=2894511 RepID=UPI00289EF555|nr:YdeI/OmpD-associated family protein [Epilithonimonas sp.]